MILLLSVLTNFRQSRIFGGYSKVTTPFYDLLIFITPTTAGIAINEKVNKKYQAEVLSNTPSSGSLLIDLFYCQNDDDFFRTIEKVDLLKIFTKFTGNSRKKNLHNLQCCRHRLGHSPKMFSHVLKNRLFPEHPWWSTINQFHVTGFFLNPLKILGNLWFSDVLRGYRK